MAEHIPEPDVESIYDDQDTIFVLTFTRCGHARSASGDDHATKCR